MTKTYETPVIFAPQSGNKKITGRTGAVSTTYVSIEASCPDSCELKLSKECYATLGPTGMHARRLDEPSRGLDPRDIARHERDAIDASFDHGPVPQDGARGGRDLRLHTAGDTRTPSAARELAKAGRRWLARGGGKVWTYTHAWAQVPRSEWGSVQVLGSANKLADIPLIVAQGYAPAAIVPDFESDKAQEIHGVRMIPCPAQTRDNVGCADCRLCLDADGLKARNSGILFKVHGVKRTQLGRRLLSNG